MSGLAVVWHRDGRPVEPGSVEDMLAAVPYRAPDGQRVWAVGDVTLGHAAFSVTPQDRGAQQPLISPRTGCVIVSDLRIDNRAELLADLPESAPPDISDADLVLRAYDAWGLDAPRRLLGDFAFVVWDPREQRLVAARDSSGQRSLFYRVDARRCSLASEIHQLLQNPTIPVAPNLERLYDYLVPRNLLRNEAQDHATFYAGVHAIPPGHMLRITRDDVRLDHYWELGAPHELRYKNDDEYVEHFRSLFLEVVGSRLRVATRVGALLSGGLDSGSIVCAAQSLWQSGVLDDPGFTSFSMIFDGLECDERPFIQEIQARYGFDSRRISSGSFAGRVQLEPRGFREAPNLGVSRDRDALLGEAVRAGVRVLLTGEMADACVGGGQLVFDSLLKQRKIGALVKHLRAYHRVSGERWRTTLCIHTLLPLLPIAVQRQVRGARLRHGWQKVHARLLPAWMSEDVRRDLSQRHLAIMQNAERGRRFGNQVRESEYQLLYPPEVARHPVPWPIEMWRPFADRRLHAFLLAIPPEQKFAPHPTSNTFYAGSKRLLRASMRGIVPESVRTRTSKTVFNVALEEEIRRQWPMYETAFGPGATSRIASVGLVDPQRFWTRLEEARAGVVGNDLLYLVQLAGVETWLRSFGQPRSDLVRTVAGARDYAETVERQTASGMATHV